MDGAHPTKRRAGADSPANLKQRARQHVVLLFDDFTVAFAESEASLLLGERLRPFCRLPVALERAVRRALAATPNGISDDVFYPGVTICASVMSGAGNGNLIGIFVERCVRREDLVGAAARYGLTRRQVEILQLLMRGFDAVEIASQLYLADSTVEDHFKRLLKRTQSRNRAEMIAKVLGADAVSGP